MEESNVLIFLLVFWVAAAGIAPDRMIIRELRSELLPGRTLWYGGPVSAVNTTKTLRKLSIKGQRPLVIQLLEAPPQPLAAGVLRLWAQRRLNPLADEVNYMYTIEGVADGLGAEIIPVSLLLNRGQQAPMCRRGRPWKFLSMVD